MKKRIQKSMKRQSQEQETLGVRPGYKVSFKQGKLLADIAKEPSSASLIGTFILAGAPLSEVKASLDRHQASVISKGLAKRLGAGSNLQEGTVNLMSGAWARDLHADLVKGGCIPSLMSIDGIGVNLALVFHTITRTGAVGKGWSFEHFDKVREFGDDFDHRMDIVKAFCEHGVHPDFFETVVKAGADPLAFTEALRMLRKTNKMAGPSEALKSIQNGGK